MRVVMFYHSLISDWNHGNAHFLRGVARELQYRGHAVTIYEPHDGWSLASLIAEHGCAPITRFHGAYPDLRSTRYDLGSLDLDRALDEADLVLVHEWNSPALIARLGAHRAAHPHYLLLFHDTHHRSVSDRDGIAAFNLSGFDGVLAYGRVIRDRYLREGWARRAWTWHEAADITVFKPMTERREGDLVWIGNWADDERANELREFLLGPVSRLGLRAAVHGVRYPPAALAALAGAGIRYEGWLANYDVPRVLARYSLTVHIPRRPYATALPGIPTIRPFEAMACGVPLVSAPWDDVEGLFSPGEDFLVAADGGEMQAHIRAVLDNPAAARAMARRAHRTILARHTCGHRVDELLAICEELSGHHPRMAVTA
jgi:spore maturation protein CgeB